MPDSIITNYDFERMNEWIFLSILICKGGKRNYIKECFWRLFDNTYKDIAHYYRLSIGYHIQNWYLSWLW